MRRTRLPEYRTAEEENDLAPLPEAEGDHPAVDEVVFLTACMYRKGFNYDFIRYAFIKPFIKNKKTRWDGDIRHAARLWFSDREAAVERYGEISEWDTFYVTNMSGLFKYRKKFNEDISWWNVSRVTDMSYLFYCAREMASDLSRWDVSNVTDMRNMFYWASAFDNDSLVRWNVGNVTNMASMFSGCQTFNQDLSAWDVGKVTNMSYMFYDAQQFNSAIGTWNTKSLQGTHFMFHNARAFVQDLSNWDTSALRTYVSMFDLCSIPQRNKPPMVTVQQEPRSSGKLVQTLTLSK